MTISDKPFDVDSYPEAEFIKAHIDYEITQNDVGLWAFTIKEKATGKVLQSMDKMENEDIADGCFVHAMYIALCKIKSKNLQDFDYRVWQANDSTWQYFLNDKMTGEELSYGNRIANQDSAYERLSLALMQNGCDHKTAACLMLEGQGKIKTHDDGTIEILGLDLESNDAVLRLELEQRGQQRLPE